MKRRSLTLGCVVSILILAAIIYGTWWILFSKEAHFVLLNKNRAFNVTQVFSLALMENREETLREIVAPATWSDLNLWLESHEPVLSCAAPPWDLEHPPWFAVGHTSNDGRFREESLYLSLPCQERYYCLTIKDIRLERTEDGWQIYEWQEPVEEFSPFPCN